MKVLHTSDWHLGMPMLEEDQKFFFSQLYEIIVNEKVDAVICAGDVYDTSVSKADAISLYNEIVTKICMDLGVPMVIIAGNHDGAERLANCNALLERCGLHLAGRITKDIKPISLGNSDIYPIPFFNKDEIRYLFPNEEIKTQEQAMKVVCDNIRNNMDKTKVNIIVSHSLIVNSELSESDRSARIGGADAISKNVFDEFDYVALGHIHKPQVISDTIRYSGSPVKYSFSEENQEKGVVIFDTETKKQTVIPVKPLHDRKTVVGTYDEIIKQDLKDYYLRLQITDRYASLELMTEIKQMFPYTLELFGKGMEQSDNITALKISELKTMTELDIMEKFMEETFSLELTDNQRSLFDKAMQDLNL